MATSRPQTRPKAQPFNAALSLVSDPLMQLALGCLSSDDQRALERDLALASQVQRQLLPRPDLRFSDWQIHYQYNPAGIVSGDYCDLIPPTTTDGKLMFLLGDVSGKGVAASLLMTHLHATFRTLASMDLELQTLLGIANRLFCESTSAGQYATLVCGRASTTGEVEIVSAGHLPVLLVTRHGVKELNATGIPLGIFSTSTYTVHRTQIRPGDSLFLFTDGVSEAYDPSGCEYGIGGLARSAGERYGWAADELVSGCREDVERYSHGARPTDDQTLLAIHLTESDDMTFQAIDMQPEVEFLAEGA